MKVGADYSLSWIREVHLGRVFGGDICELPSGNIIAAGETDNQSESSQGCVISVSTNGVL